MTQQAAPPHAVERRHSRGVASGKLRNRFADLLARADVRLDGGRPWDVRVRDERLFRRVALDGLLGLGDAYVDGWWDCDAVDELFARSLRSNLPARLPVSRSSIAYVLRHRLLNVQSRPRARRNGRDHYDRGNDLFRAMLDRRMVYTCAFWRDAADLDAAQEAKLEMACRKIGLRPGQRVLDVGCGWGSFAKYAAERHGAEVVGVTVSPEQVRLGRELCAGLPVELRLQDYRDVTGTFDHVVSLGMFEHVGPKNHRAYFQKVRQLLAPDGLFLLQTISVRDGGPSLRDGELVWFERHIFPGAILPSLAQLGAGIDGLFTLEDLHNFGADYDLTLMSWDANFQRAYPALHDADPACDGRFRRLWSYYLLAAAGAFRARRYSLWQAVLSPNGVAGGWRREG